MDSEIDGLSVEVCNETICISLDCGENNNYYSLTQVQEIQGLLAIAAAKLRGKLAKEATNA
jgi:hypothetical protein